MNSDLAKHKAPLFVDGSELLLPVPQGKTGVLNLSSGQEITLACPGNKNQVRNVSSERCLRCSAVRRIGKGGEGITK